MVSADGVEEKRDHYMNLRRALSDKIENNPDAPEHKRSGWEFNLGRVKEKLHELNLSLA
jgi:hypothetical protein